VQGNPLDKLAATVDFEMFRPDLTAALGLGDPAKGDRPGFNPALKFRMLVLQGLHELSMDLTEYLVSDRLSWMRLCALAPGDAVPDAHAQHHQPSCPLMLQSFLKPNFPEVFSQPP
jgi:transposase, IS5 family